MLFRSFVLARCEPGSQRHQGLVLLLVPLAQPGVTIRPIRQMTGVPEFNEVFFDDARTEASLHLGAPGAGWRVAMALLGFERGMPAYDIWIAALIRTDNNASRRVFESVAVGQREYALYSKQLEAAP